MRKVAAQNPPPPSSDVYKHSFVSTKRRRKMADKTADTHQKLWKQEFLPSSDKRALVVFVHGIQEHSSRYSHVFQQFAKLGFYCVAYDHQGHGRSDDVKGRRASCGAPGNGSHPLDEFVDDLEIIVDLARSEHGTDLPFFLWGQSFGGCVAVNFALRQPDLFKGAKSALILTSPFLGQPKKTGESIIIPVAMQLSKIIPNARLVAAVKVTDMSRDKTAQEDYRTDPFNMIVPLRLCIGVASMHGAATAHERAAEITANLLVCYGDNDRCCSLKFAEKFFNKAASKEKELEIFPGLYHTLLHEPEKQKVIDFMSGYILKHL